MKELSIEEKAKRYDEAYKKVAIRFGSNVADEIFPELKESEDERIRLKLIEAVKGDMVVGGTKDKQLAVAWLEKQSTPQVRTGLEWVNTIDDACNKRYAEEYAHGEYCHEQSFKWGFQEGVDWFEKQGEQKHAWSEEDEDNFKHLVDEIVCLGNSRNSANRLYYDRLIKFLGELKDRAQPREEWCETDERKLDRLIAYFEDRVAFTDKDDLEYAEWLKSLKRRVQPQSTWKPSDEQMGVIEAVINNRSFQRRHLDSLYEQLKKLRRNKL